MIKNGLFTVHSPIQREEEPSPEKMKTSRIAKRLKILSARVNGLLKARETCDKVYSNGFFENHYPKADKRLKELLHEKCMLAHSRALNDDLAPEEVNDAAQAPVVVPQKEEPEEREEKPISVTISVGR